MSQPPNDGIEAGTKRWGIGGWLLVLAALTIGFINYPLRIVGWQFDHLPGDGIDDALNNYILEHGYRYLSGRVDSFWDAPFFYPTLGVTAYSDAHLGMLPLYAALRLVGLSPEAAFQGWFVIPFFLNFASAAWALRRLGANSAGVATGAYVFAFGLPLAGQFGHAQLLPRFLVPLSVVMGWEFLRSKRTSQLAACCACVVWQIYVSIYIGYFLVLLIACGLVISAILYGSQLPWKDLFRAGKRVWLLRSAVLLLSGLALLPLGLAHAREVSGMGVEGVRSAAPIPRGWITPPNVAAITVFLNDRESPLGGEQKVFPGFLAFLAVGLGSFQAMRKSSFGDRTSQTAVAAWTVLVLCLFVTVFDGIWLYRPMLEIPGGSAVRAVGRVVLVLLFPIAIAIAFFTDIAVARVQRFNRPVGAAIAVVVLALEAADNWLSLPDGDCKSLWIGERSFRDTVVARQEQIKLSIKRHPHPTLVYVFPPKQIEPHDQYVLQLDAMRASQDLGIPCVNGYSGYLPIGWDIFQTKDDLMKWLDSQKVPGEKRAGLVLIDEAGRD